MLRMPGVGVNTINRLLANFAIDQVFSASAAALHALGCSAAAVESLQRPDWALVDQDLAWLAAQPDNHVLTLHDDRYPPRLREIGQPPPVLFVKGNVELLAAPQIAMVGSRNPSRQGEQLAEDFAAELARAGFAVTSGMALGIDAASHRGALAAGGYTIAVAGTGLDRVYPARHKQLATQIVSRGAIVSEFPPGTVAKPNHFPRRNRIISGLCLGLLVVEAAQQSGSLITARLALDQNREVFAIPGSIHNPLARGCNALIRQGAKLVETVADIFEELGCAEPLPAHPAPVELQSELDPEQQTLLNLVAFSPTSVDTLVRVSGWSVETVSSMLLLLELQGYIATSAGGGYSRLL